MAFGIDSGDRREGSKNTNPQSGTATGNMESKATDKNDFQQNISSAVGSGSVSGGAGPTTGFHGYGVNWQDFTASKHPASPARWYDSWDISMEFPSPDIIAGGTGAEARFYYPTGNNVTTQFAQALEFDLSSSSNFAFNASVDPASDNYGTLPYETGSTAITSGNSITVCFVRLLPKGTYVYNYILDEGFSPAISGFSANCYWSTALGDNLITTVDGSGNSSAGSPITFVVTAPWAWIKIALNNVATSGASFQLNGFFLQFSSYTP